MSRSAAIARKTAETTIEVKLQIDGGGNSSIHSGIGFFDHMLVLLSRHGLFDLTVRCAGDLEVDGHHTVEDIGIVLGQALKQSLGDKQGIKRYGTAFVPMDEALAMVSLDISGRPYLVYDVATPAPSIGAYDCELTEEFLRALAVNAGLTLHVKLLTGKNSHHIIEAIFKALGRALDEATRQDERIVGVMSTKGTLEG
ncbi:imidazoleglycerol-phosphate dehydratase HisB|uniref:Imidazoleglycerol-phosphate dehydratase n=1 Tax=Dendrosporobacter quercicolus TaxID=146817 RepID=A0A1G9NWK9_9FIRM|nr:imidazoleglycerol-phosphate dehydratase HisB [Dendrosporobacter quercicolus]NSL47466.1 imidazoleglycerol-phosphate dehydratase HisB [Dendrosporobacter quercicolus DSM 1736]SDL90751.1 imidazoleglycerol-phosphate dehydratase [Dendrosporobacter quercicolus]